MLSKLAAGAALGAVLILLAITIIAGGGTVSSNVEAPPGGCVVLADYAPTSAPGGGTTSANQKTASLNANQMAAARTVVAVGKGMGIAERGIAIALGTAMQESTLDPNAVNGRSVGLFQQQGDLYAKVNRTDTADASRAFYEQLLARVPNYADRAAGTFADIAQTVQLSGAGAIKYAEWENWATALAHQLVTGGSTGSVDAAVDCNDGGGSGPTTVERSGREVTLPARAGVAGKLVFPNDQAATAAAAALSYLGTPYAWGGGDRNGPTKGLRGDNAVADQHGDYNKIGFDCSGLTEFAWAQAGIAIGGDSRTQWAIAGPEHPYSEALGGDLLFWGAAPHAVHHVALYLGKIDGKDYMVESPQSGDFVKVSVVRTGGDFQNTAMRPWEN